MSERSTTPNEKTASFSVLMRVDANPGIGSQRLLRMIGLADACRRHNADVTIVSGDIPKTLQHKITEAGCAFIRHDFRAGSIEDAKFTSDRIDAMGCDWTIVDGSGFDRNFHKTIRNASQHLLTTTAESAADIYLNQSGVAPATPNAPYNMIGGPQHLLLAPDFLPSSQSTAAGRKNVRFFPNRILVAFDQDEQNSTLRTIRTLHHLNLDGPSVPAFDVIIDRDYAYEKELAGFCRDAQMNVRIHRNVDRKAALFGAADLAIVGVGSVCFELAQTGVPTIAVATQDAHKPLLQMLMKRGIAAGFDMAGQQSSIDTPGDAIFPTNIHQAINALISNRAQRQKMSDNAKQLLDGFGADRIARRLHAEVITLRDTQNSDSYRLLSIAKQSIASGQSFHSAFSMSNHQTWLNGTHANKQQRLWLVEDRNATPLATAHVGFDRDSQSAKLTVALAEQASENDLSSTIFEKVTRNIWADATTGISAEVIVTTVKPSDTAICQSLEAVGFELGEPDVVNQQIALQYIRRRDTADVLTPPVPLKRSA